MKELCVFFQSYKNKEATEFVIKNFRRHHPDSPFTLFSDAGCDFSLTAKKYNCNYIHSFINLGRQGHQKIKIESEYSVDRWLAFNKEEIFVWLNRFYQACKFGLNQGSTHILMLEDDVYITNKITLNPSWDFSCGCNERNFVNSGVLEYIKEKYSCNPNVDYYACCGGAIFNCKIFVEKYFDIYKFIDNDFEILQSLDRRMGWIDFYMQIIYYVIGCKYTPNPQFVETWMPVDWRSSKYSIVHQYKELYN